MAQFILSAFADEANESLDGQITALKRNHVSCIEVRSVNGGLQNKPIEEVNAIYEQLNENGITVSSYGSPIGKADIHNDFDEYLAKDFAKAILICKALHTKRMRMFSFFVKDEEKADCRDEVIRRLEIMTNIAKENGIQLCHENESKIFGQNVPEVRDILNNVPGIRGIFDAANYVMNDQNPYDGFMVTLPTLEYMHVKDAVFAQKLIAPSGEGDGQYEKIIAKLDSERNDTIVLTLEPHLHIFSQYKKIDSHKLETTRSFDDSDSAFDYAVNALKKILTNLGFHEEGYVWKK